jgi:hypothetical protein
MHMIYNSSNYCVVEFGAIASRAEGAFEIMDKTARREIFLDGVLAASFRKDVEDLIATQPSTEEIDEFLSQFDELMFQSMTMH